MAGIAGSRPTRNPRWRERPAARRIPWAPAGSRSSSPRSSSACSAGRVAPPRSVYATDVATRHGVDVDERRPSRLRSRSARHAQRNAGSRYSRTATGSAPATPPRCMVSRRQPGGVGRSPFRLPRRDDGTCCARGARDRRSGTRRDRREWSSRDRGRATSPMMRHTTFTSVPTRTGGDGDDSIHTRDATTRRPEVLHRRAGRAGGRARDRSSRGGRRGRGAGSTSGRPV